MPLSILINNNLTWVFLQASAYKSTRFGIPVVGSVPNFKFALNQVYNLRANRIHILLFYLSRNKQLRCSLAFHWHIFKFIFENILRSAMDITKSRSPSSSWFGLDWINFRIFFKNRLLGSQNWLLGLYFSAFIALKI